MTQGPNQGNLQNLFIGITNYMWPKKHLKGKDLAWAHCCCVSKHRAPCLLIHTSFRLGIQVLRIPALCPTEQQTPWKRSAQPWQSLTVLQIREMTVSATQMPCSKEVKWPSSGACYVKSAPWERWRKSDLNNFIINIKKNTKRLDDILLT